MAHTRPITDDFWYDEDPGDEGPFPGYHQIEPPAQTAPGGVFGRIAGAVFGEDVGRRVEQVEDVIFGTREDQLPLTEPTGETRTYLDPEEGVFQQDPNDLTELPDFEVIASEQEDLPGQNLPGASRGWDPYWGFVDDAWDYATWWWGQNDRNASRLQPAPELETVETGETMEDVATVPTPGGYYPEPGEVPAACAPGARRFSASKARSILLKRAAYAIGQCNLKYSSFKWLVVHTGIANAIRTLALSEREVNFLLLNPVKRRGRGISPANIRTVNRTMRKLESLNARLNCACGTKKSYRRKRKSCR